MATRTKKTPSAEQLRRTLTKRIGDSFKLSVYLAVDDLRANWERTDNIARADLYQTADNIVAVPDDKMTVREIMTIPPAVYEMLWVLCNNLVIECNRAEFPANFNPTNEAIAEHLDESISDAVTPPMIRFMESTATGAKLSAHADPTQAIENTIRGQLTSLTTRGVICASLSEVFMKFMKSLAAVCATFVWYEIQCKPTFSPSRVDEGLISAILITRGFPPEIVDKMYGGILPKVKKASAKKAAAAPAPTTTNAETAAVEDDIAALLDSSTQVNDSGLEMI